MALFECVAHGLDVVPVGITHEGPVVVRVVLGPHSRLVEYFGARGHGGFEEGLDGGSVGRSEGYVRLAKPLARGSRAHPKVGLLSDAEADHLAEVQYSSAAKRGEHRIVEGGAGRHVGALDRDVVKHGDIVLGASLNEQAEGMTSRVEVDANAVLWLEVSECCPDGERVRSALVQIVNMNIQVQHLLLLPESFRPYRGSIVRLGLKRQASSPLGTPEQDPVRLAPFHLPPKELSIEVREDMRIRTVQDHRCKREPGSLSHGITISTGDPSCASRQQTRTKKHRRANCIKRR